MSGLVSQGGLHFAVMLLLWVTRSQVFGGLLVVLPQCSSIVRTAVSVSGYISFHLMYHGTIASELRESGLGIAGRSMIQSVAISMLPASLICFPFHVADVKKETRLVSVVSTVSTRSG